MSAVLVKGKWSTFIGGGGGGGGAVKMSKWRLPPFFWKGTFSKRKEFDSPLHMGANSFFLEQVPFKKGTDVQDNKQDVT